VLSNYYFLLYLKKNIDSQLKIYTLSKDSVVKLSIMRMNNKSLMRFFFFLPFLLPLITTEAQHLSKTTTDDNSKYTNVGNIAITVSNYGVFGNGFKLWPTQPSFQYPRGSGIEHMFIGGLWVGASTVNGYQVTTGAVDVSSIKSGVQAGFEFTTGKDSKVIEKSSLPDNAYYSPDAISHQDFIADFTDTNRTNPNEGNETITDHTPMGINVHMETYAFNYAFADNFVIFNYWIKNVSRNTLDSVYVALYADLVVRNTNVTAPYGAAFFNKGGLGYVDTLNLAYAYDYNGDGGLADSYAGIEFLGASPFKTSTSYQSWTFNSSYSSTNNLLFFPSTDPDKYAKMATGLLPLQIKNALVKPLNNMTMLTVGPFSHIAVGDSINVVFALMAAKMKTWGGPDPDDLTVYPHNRDKLNETCGWARRTYNGEDRNGNGIQDTNEIWTGPILNGHQQPKRYFLPAPPNPPRVKVVLSSKLAEIYWDRGAEDSKDPISNLKDFEGYRIYGTNAGVDLTESQDFLSNLILLGDFDRPDDNIGYNTGFSKIRLAHPVQFLPDTTHYYYKFSVPYLLNGWQYGFAVTAYDSGDASTNLASLESSKLQTLKRVVVGTQPVQDGSVPVSVYPNPYYTRAYWDGSQERDRKLYFCNLPAHSEIVIYTLAGDVIDVLQHDAATYNASDIRWFQKYSDGSQQIAGGEHAWNLITRNDQAIASGLYLFTVKNKDNGDIQRGKFLVIK